jgi:DNA-binding winged helix-turn-helix (wHTH) protein
LDGDFHFGDWLVQSQLNSIKGPEKTTLIEPKVMEVLVYLARHAGNVVANERLMQSVWGDTFVTDEVLTNAIWELRKAFGDDARRLRVIQTVFKKG